MIAVKVQGTCLCGRYSEAVGADEADARILLNHEHGHEYKHAFDGEMTFKAVDTNAPKKPRRAA